MRNQTFSECLMAALDRRRMTVTAFGGLAGMSQQRANTYARGIAKPPLECVEQWADILKMGEGPERDDFLLAAYQSYRWGGVAERFADMRSRLTKAKAPSDAHVARQINNLEQTVRDLAALIKDLEDVFIHRGPLGAEDVRRKRAKLVPAMRRAIVEHYQPAQQLAQQGAQC